MRLLTMVRSSSATAWSAAASGTVPRSAMVGGGTSAGSGKGILASTKGLKAPVLSAQEDVIAATLSVAAQIANIEQPQPKRPSPGRHPSSKPGEAHEVPSGRSTHTVLEIGTREVDYPAGPSP
jgi:hypothetical protein